jgi:hypothetical protein
MCSVYYESVHCPLSFDGRFVEHWDELNTLDVFVQVGAPCRHLNNRHDLPKCHGATTTSDLIAVTATGCDYPARILPVTAETMLP